MTALRNLGDDFDAAVVTAIDARLQLTAEREKVAGTVARGPCGDRSCRRSVSALGCALTLALADDRCV
jgi:hypothetical protein